MLDAARMFFYLFGVLAIAGGSMGFLKAKSMASLIAGGLSGLLLLLAAYWMGPARTLGLGLALVLSVALAARFVPAYAKTRKLVPAGLMAAMSVVGVLMAAVAAVTLAACQTTADANRAEGLCAQLGQTCTISKGLLGVCSPPAPGACAKEPCFVCLPQH